MNVHFLRLNVKVYSFPRMFHFNHANIYLCFFIIFCFVARSFVTFSFGWSEGLYSLSFPLNAVCVHCDF